VRVARRDDFAAAARSSPRGRCFSAHARPTSITQSAICAQESAPAARAA
jgi:hypothetical protein